MALFHNGSPFKSFGSPFCSKLGPLEIVEQCNGQRWETMGKWISESISESQGRRGLLERLVHLKLEKKLQQPCQGCLGPFCPWQCLGEMVLAQTSHVSSV